MSGAATAGSKAPAPALLGLGLGLVRRGRGVMSATMATVMVRYAQMASSVIRMAQISSGRLPVLFAIAMSGRCCHDR